MGAGGIINDRVKALVTLLMQAAYYESLTQDEQDALESVSAIPYLATTQENLDNLKNIFNCVVERG